MNKLETILSKWNFKKIAIGYLILALIAGLACAGTIVYLYRERLGFSWHYTQLEDAAQEDTLLSAVDKTAAASGDVVDVLTLDAENNVIYSAKGSQFAAGKLEFLKTGSSKKYLSASAYPGIIFRYVKSGEFVLQSILAKDFSQVKQDFGDDSFGDPSLSGKTVYMLSRVVTRSGNTVLVITEPSAVPGGMTALKITAALAMLLFCIYWVLIALWLYKDAAKCKLSPIYWGLIGLLTNLAGLVVYKLYKRSMELCSNCGAAQDAGRLYCGQCGAQLGSRCSRCGAKASPKDSFCPQCGAPRS